jgi:AhpD family alkylhydroperoxidase
LGWLGEELALTLAGTNRCDYCASAHSATGKLAGLKEADVTAALKGKAEDAREAAALKFASAVVEKRGRIDDADFKAVTDAGFTPGEVSEIVAHVVVNSSRITSTTSREPRLILLGPTSRKRPS